MDVINVYFNSHKYPLISHQLDSFREFLRTHIPNVIKSSNPITMIKIGELRVDVNIGYNGNIHIDRPVLSVDGKDVLLTPNEARLRNLTYQTNIYADVQILFFEGDNVEPIEFDNNENIFKDVYIGSVPIMLHSDACILNGQNASVLRELNECVNDYGGYFIIDGKEKVIISQERITKNRLFTQYMKNDNRFSHKAYISCVAEKGEGSLYPKRLEFYMYKKGTKVLNNPEKYYYMEKLGFDNMVDSLSGNEAIHFGRTVVRISKVDMDIPLGLLFKQLGAVTNEDVYHLIFGKERCPQYEDFIRPIFLQMNMPMTLVDYIMFSSGKTLNKEIVKGIIYVDVFPNIDSLDGKLKYLGYLTKQFALFTMGHLEETDKDSYFYKRIDVSGIMLTELFNETYDKFKKAIRDSIDRIYHYGAWRSRRKVGVDNKESYKMFMGGDDSVRKLIPALYMSETFMNSLKGRWGLANSDEYEEGKVQDLSRISYVGYLSHVRRIDIDIDRSLKLFNSHRLHVHQWGIVCPYETPDGASIGYLKNLALLAKITAGSSQDDVLSCLRVTGMFVELDDCHPVVMNNNDTTCVILNGTLIGVTHHCVKLFEYLKLCKRTGHINILTGVAWDVLNNELKILTESGRAMRPLIVIDKGVIPDMDNMKNWFDGLLGNYNKDYDEDIYTRVGFINPYKADDTIDDVIDRLKSGVGSIEYIDVEEADVCLIALDKKDVNIRTTHMEIHPCTLLSVVSVNIPMCNHSFAARNLFHAAQSKQAIGMYATNFNERYDTMGYVMHYPQKPIISTRPSFLTRSEMMPNGTNIMIAVMSYSGFNQEDSLMINKAVIDRGFERISYYKSISVTTKVESPMERTFFANPKKMLKDGFMVKGIKTNADYSLLDDNGFVKKGTKVPQGKDTVLIGVVLERTVIQEVKKGVFTRSVKRKEYIDQSFITDDNVYGYVDSVYKTSKSVSDSSSVCKLRLMKVRHPECGDKHSSRHGQKGVIGRIIHERDMPFTKHGVKPDIIMNSHAFPSRMTIGHIVECVFAKLCALKGGIGDGTVFVPFDRKSMMEDLNNEGFDRYGNEVLYNGFTGEQIKTDVFIGPVYYFRLKHMVADKINARGIGPKQFLTRQPTAGRRKHGGLRIGEMERDALIGHGVSMFIKESMMERSDAYRYQIDTHSGTAVNTLVPSIAEVEVPYSFKLFTQELECMGIQTHFNVTNLDIQEKEVETELDGAYIDREYIDFITDYMKTVKKEEKKDDMKNVKKNVKKDEKKDEKKDVKKEEKKDDKKDDKKEEKKEKKEEKKDKTCDDIDCPPEKVCNPETLRCINKDGAVAKKLGLSKKGGSDDNISLDEDIDDVEDGLEEDDIEYEGGNMYGTDNDLDDEDLDIDDLGNEGDIKIIEIN